MSEIEVLAVSVRCSKCYIQQDADPEQAQHFYDSYVRKCRDRSGKAVGAKLIHQWNGIEKNCFDFRTVYHSHFGQEPPLGHHQCKELISETKKPNFLSPVSVMTVLNFQICLYTKGLTQDKKTAVYRKEQGGISED